MVGGQGPSPNQTCHGLTPPEFHPHRGQRREEALSLAVLCTREKISNRGENAFHWCELCSSEHRRGGRLCGAGGTEGRVG